MLSLIILTILIVILTVFKRYKPAAVARVICINIIVIELLAYGALLNMARQGQNFYLIGNQHILDGILRNYIIQKIHRDGNDLHGLYEVDYQKGYTVNENAYYGSFKVTNSARMRNDHEYTLLPQENKLRIAAFGDSFVFCDGELSQNCWTSFLEKAVDNMEVLNFGVSGYGLGQSYLRYVQEGLPYNPDVLMINYFYASPDRDQFQYKAILSGRPLINADLYRVQFYVEDGILKYRSMSPMDLFDAAFREKYIYQPLGINTRTSFWALKIFSVSNTGLLFKQAALKNSVPQKNQKCAANRP